MLIKRGSLRGDQTRAVTRADVARRAGVSPAVVSYVLNPGSRPVSADARKRIEAAIEELGYRPNAIAQALRRSSTMSIGLMVPDLANPIVAALTQQIEDLAYARGYVLFVGTVGYDDAREERYIRTYVDRQVDALVMVGAHKTPVLREMASKGMPVVVLDRIEPGHGISSVYSESRAGAAGVVRHLIEEHGHRRIACIGGPEDVTGVGEDRRDGWRDALESAGLDTCGLLFDVPHYSRDAGYRGGQRLLDESEATAIFVSSDVQAVGLVGAIRERGLRVPDDIAVVTFDNSEVAARAFPTFTAVDANVRGIALRTMERLGAKLDKSDLSETHDVVPSSLVIRRSCGCELPAA